MFQAKATALQIARRIASAFWSAGRLFPGNGIDPANPGVIQLADGTHQVTYRGRLFTCIPKTLTLETLTGMGRMGGGSW